MMMESRDPAIKLFGMKIPFPTVFESAVAVEDNEEEDEVMEWSGGDGGERNSPDKVTQELTEKNNDNSLVENFHESKPENGDKEETASVDQLESNESPESNQETTPDGKPVLKKPTKILPCPRCKSMDTKFCYYNNYNINQPRHFCKACQRYWTAGGTMRNVPVGAGRRKHKSSSSSHYRHITISEALEAARLDPGLQANTRVLSFALEARQQQPIAPVMKLQGNQQVSNGFHGLGDQRLVAQVENGDDCSSGSSVTTSNNHSVEDSRTQSFRAVEPNNNNNNNNSNGYACIPGVPWPYTWNPAMPPPGFYPPPGYPIPFYPYWTIPMLPPQQPSSSPMSQNGSNQNSPTLGKHSREEQDNETEQKQRNGSVLVPKTLRIDDPNEAAKSSIWTTLGIKNEGLSKAGGMFKGFDQKTKKNNNNDKAENSSLLSANPAALSRSLDFHERA